MLAVAALVVAAGVTAMRARNGVETGLYSLLDLERRGMMAALAENLGGQLRVLVEGPNWDSLQASADTMRTLLRRGQPPSPVGSLFAQLPTDGLLSEEVRQRLLAGKYDEQAKHSATLLFSGFLTPLFPVKQDPFLLATDYVLNLQSHVGEGWSLRDGDLAREDGVPSGQDACCPSERGARCCLLLTAEAASAAGGTNNVASVDFAWVEQVYSTARELNERAGEVRVYCSGAPFHTARAVASSQREINLLSAISLVAVLGLGWLLFRSLRFVPYALLVLGVGGLVAVAALLVLFPRPHVVTFVFGTSLIGLSVDYAYHALAARGARKIFFPMTCALATTLACFAPLLFSSVEVLRQMSVFTSAGLVAVYVTVLLFFPTRALDAMGRDALRAVRGRDGAQSSQGGAWLRYGVAALLLVGAAMGLKGLRFGNDATNFYRAEKYLAEGERRLYELGGAGSGKYAVVEGKTVQAALEREEELGVKGLSSIVPSLKRQRENAQLISNLVAKAGAQYTAMTGLKMPVAKGELRLLDAEAVDNPLLRRLIRPMLVHCDDKVMLVSPAPAKSPAHGTRTVGQGAESPAGVTILEPKAALSELFDAYARETYRMLAISLGVLTVMLVVLFRTRSILYLLPIFAAAVATLGVLGWIGKPLNFFQALCFFVFTGLGLDYAIFHRGNPEPHTRKVVLVSFLTSFVGLGMLAFTSFAVTSSMGVTLACGLGFAYYFSTLLSPRRRTDCVNDEWHRQREQSAGRLRMLFMWWVYRCLGKGVQKILVVVVMAFIYPFAGPAKRALRDFYRTLAEHLRRPDLARPSTWRLYRHLLGFAWSLCDKTDACSLKRNLPKMNWRDDESWRAFQALVAAGKGAFLISTHVGTIEVLPALSAQIGSAAPRVHAFQQMGHDAEFTRVFMRHLDDSALTLHAVEAIGVETAVEMQAAIGRGELVLMAGDRVSAGSRKTLAHDSLARACQWPKGVFAFAKLMESLVFFVTCVRVGWNAYEVRVEQFAMSKAGEKLSVPALLDQYVAFLEKEVVEHPEQWYQFYDFFGDRTGKDRQQDA